jgi:hypothetical protein
MTIAPKTIFSDVIEKVNAVLHGGRYANPSDFEWRKIKRECENLRNTDAAAGWAALSSLYAAFGDVVEMKRCYVASRHLRLDSAVESNFLANLGNLGLFDEALKFFIEHGNPTIGNFSSMLSHGFEIGAFQTIVGFSELAKTMNIDPSPEILSKSAAAAAVLSRAGLNDQDIAHHLNAVGNVLRDRKIFHYAMPEVRTSDVDGDFSGVTVVFRVSGSSDDVFEMNVALAEQEDVMNIKKDSSFDALFLPL